MRKCSKPSWRRKCPPRVREYLTKLRVAAFLQIKDGYIDTGAAPGKDTRWQEVAQLKRHNRQLKKKYSRVPSRDKHVLGVAIPGTTGQVKTLAETEKPPKPPKHTAKADMDPEARAAAQAKADSGPPMAPIKQ